MTGLLFMLALTSALHAATPPANQPLGDDQARFLLSRSGFAPSAAEVAAISGLTPAAAVDTLLAATTTQPRLPAPSFVHEPIVPLRNMLTEEAKMAERELQARYALELRGWWLQEMVQTTSPLSERMALFWHGHFATSQQKIRYSQPMYAQHLQLRAHATGSFARLLHAMARDPAMLVYLDGANNRKESPNENFAREVMELFTLGEGHYSETDVKEAARAFTGWGVERDTFTFVLRPGLRDNGDKQVLGKRGNLDGDAVLAALLEQPQTAVFITTKLMREFVTLNPQTSDVTALAAVLRNGAYELKPLLRALFLSDAFWADANRASLVKSPTELMVGAFRQFDIAVSDALPLAIRGAGLGQNLFAPPNVKGWPGGTAWITSTSLLERKQFMEQLFKTFEPATQPGSAMLTPPDKPGMPDMQAARMQLAQMREGRQLPGLRALGREGILRIARAQANVRFDAQTWLNHYGAHIDREPSATQRIALQNAVLPIAPVNPTPAGLVGVAYLRSLVMDPAYQLK